MVDSEPTWEEEAIKFQLDKRTNFSCWKLFGRDQDDLLRIEIGVVLFSRKLEQDVTKNPPSLRIYCENFSEKEREQIENIFRIIRAKIPKPGKIKFSCTYLSVNFDSSRAAATGTVQQFLLFRCAPSCPSSSDNGDECDYLNVFFIEINGRTYRNWNDFVESNQFPATCEYFAPKDGVYEAEGQIRKFKKTTASTSRFVDTAFTLAGLGYMTADLFISAAAPVSSTTAAIAMTAYGTYRSFSVLVDRYRHSESVKINNVDSFSIYLSLLTIYMTEICSTIIFLKQQKIPNVSIMGTCWDKLCLTAINGGVLCLDIISFSLNARLFFKKAKTKELQSLDLFDLILHTFMLYSQVKNTVEVHEMLSDPHFYCSFQKLTKSQKRNLKKRKAKAAKRDSSAGGKSSKNFFQYQKDLYELLKWTAHYILDKSGEFLVKNFINNLMTAMTVILNGILAVTMQ